MCLALILPRSMRLRIVTSSHRFWIVSVWTSRSGSKSPLEAAKQFADNVGCVRGFIVGFDSDYSPYSYPALIRLSYVLSGAAMNVVYEESSLKYSLSAVASVSPLHPVILLSSPNLLTMYKRLMSMLWHTKANSLYMLFPNTSRAQVAMPLLFFRPSHLP